MKAASVLLLVLVAACSASTSKASEDLDKTNIPEGLTVTSAAFENNGTIPIDHTCKGAGTPPTISWKGLPDTTKSVALVVDDPDAPKGTFVHWVVIALPAKNGSVPPVDPAAHELDNTGGTRGWTPPCPPPGASHHYRFTVYALRDYLCAGTDDQAGTPDCSPPGTGDALGQIRSIATTKGTLVGTYP